MAQPPAYIQFDHPRLGELRAVRMENGRYQLVLEDLARALGLSRGEALARLPHQGTIPVPEGAVFKRVDVDPDAFEKDGALWDALIVHARSGG